MTDGDDDLDGYEPSIVRRMVRGHQRWSTPKRRLLFAILVPIALSSCITSALTSSTNRALNIFAAITFVWTGVTMWSRRRKPVPSNCPPPYMTWSAQRWWIGSAFVGAALTTLIAATAYAHRPLDQAIVLIIGTTFGTAAMWSVRAIANRRYAG